VAVGVDPNVSVVPAAIGAVTAFALNVTVELVESTEETVALAAMFVPLTLAPDAMPVVDPTVTVSEAVCDAVTDPAK
jgi:hypothetical protein